MMNYRREVLWVLGAFATGFLVATALLFGITSVYFIGPALLVGIVLTLIVGVIGTALVGLGARMRSAFRGATPNAPESETPRAVVTPLHGGSGKGEDDRRLAA